MHRRVLAVFLSAAFLSLCLSLAAQTPTASPLPTPGSSPTPDAAVQKAIDDLVSALEAAPSEQERAALLDRRKDLVSGKLAYAVVKRGRDISLAGNFSKGLDLILLGQHLAEQTGDQATLSTAYRMIGYVYYLQGDHQHSLEYGQKSMEVAEKIGNQKLIASSLNNIGMEQSALGDYASALDHYKRSLEISRSLGERLLITNALSNIGAALADQGKYAQAREFYQQALTTQEKAGADNAEIAPALINLGVVEHQQSNYAGAMEYYQKALALVEKGNPAALGTLLTNIGAVLTAQGNYPEAMAYYRRSLAFNEQIGAKDQVGWALMELGELEELQNNPAAALDDLQKSLAISEELGLKMRTSGLWNKIGEAYTLRGDYTAALDAHRKSLALGEELNLPMLIGDACRTISNDYYEQGKFEQSIEFADRASTIARGIGDRETLFGARTSAGKSYRALGQTAQARQAFAEAMDTVESMRADLAGGEQEGQGFLQTKIAPYQEMVEMLVAQNQGEEAMAFAERSKARILLDVLQSGKTQVTKALTESERDREQQLESTLVSLNGRIQQEKTGDKPDPVRLADLKTRVEQARIEYSQFQIALYATHPELKTQRGEFQPFTLVEAAKILPDSTAFLEFLVTTKSTYLFVLTRNGSEQPELKTYTIEIKGEELARGAEEFRHKLAERDLGFQSSARKLYDQLLKPAQAQLVGKTALVIVPDGALWNLPFQALYNGKQYLLENYAISYAPSLTVLREMMLRRQKNQEDQARPKALTLLAMADPILGKERLAHASLVYRGEQLNPLPEARHEVQALKQLYSGEVYTGTEAREDRFKAEAGKFRILHLATHGIFDDASPMYSNILLAPGTDGHEDGLLEAREIMQLDLKADLVVLSACETARGRISAGEGEIGLTWAFFVAGTPTTVVSQWKVESTSTTKLMLAFHRALENADSNPKRRPAFSKARALQQASVQLLHSPQYAHPFYWASFVIVGDPN